jgi:hypothetical protein
MSIRKHRSRAQRAVAWAVAHPWSRHFIQVGEYKRRIRKVRLEMEIGSYESVRFVVSPALAA